MENSQQFQEFAFGYQVVVTENSEYHLRGKRCLGIRSRVNGLWRDDRQMVGEVLRGCALSTTTRIELPYAGGFLCFLKGETELFSSRILLIRLPTASEVQFFMEREPEPAEADPDVVPLNDDEIEEVELSAQDVSLDVEPPSMIVDSPPTWDIDDVDGALDAPRIDSKRWQKRNQHTDSERAHTRTPLEMEILLITAGQVYECVTQDISPGGICVETFHSQPVNAQIGLEFIFFDRLHRARGTVRWSRPSGENGAVMGIQFTELEPISSQAIENFVKSYSG